jgi:serine protease Do
MFQYHLSKSEEIIRMIAFTNLKSPKLVSFILFSLGLGASSCSAQNKAPPPATLEKITPSQPLPQSSAQQPGQQPGEAALPINPNIFVQLSKKVVPSVVNISSSKTVRSSMGQGSPDDLYRKFFEEFFGPGFGGGQFPPPNRRGQPPREPKNLPKAVSLGTGFIIDSSGLILTNNHVVADADEIKINFTESQDEKPTDGEVVGRDADLDVALIRVKTKREMIPLTLGNSDALEVGEYVMAVGNPFGQGHSVTHGIISATGRLAPSFPLATYLQTDAPINPGNSGGPLVNLKGEVIGINNAIHAGAQGIGFAIPSSAVTRILPQLKTKGSVERGYIGALIGDLTPELAEKLNVPTKDAKSPYVTSVTPGEPAAKAGIKPYDVILSVNGTRVTTSGALISAVTAIPVGNDAKIVISRDGKEMTVNLKVAKRPGSPEKKETPKKSERPSQIDTGMTLKTLTPEVAKQIGVPMDVSGVVVMSIDEYEGPAVRAGLNRGDVIIEVDKKPVKDIDSFYSIVKEKKSYLLRVLKSSGEDGQSVYGVSILNLKD